MVITTRKGSHKDQALIPLERQSQSLCTIHSGKKDTSTIHLRNHKLDYSKTTMMLQSHLKSFLLFALLGISFLKMSLAFSPINTSLSRTHRSVTESVTFLNAKRKEQPQIGKTISGSRRKQLGIGEGEDEYDLGVALDVNTDPFITKVIAGSLIVAIIALLVAGIIIPATTDYGEGVCRPILTGGRC